MADVARPNSDDKQGGLLMGDSRSLLIALGVIVVMAMLIIPLPTPLLDVLMAFNLVLSLLVLLIVLYSHKPTEFSLFPTVLLVDFDNLILLRHSETNG
jgi:flagellar biosynthesis protein FlhA